METSMSNQPEFLERVSDLMEDREPRHVILI